MLKEPQKEQRTSKTDDKEVYHYYSLNKRPIFKTKEIFGDRIVFYPYTVNLAQDTASPKRIKIVEFVGWGSVDKLPNIFRKKPGYGLKFTSSTQFLNLLYKTYPNLEKVVISLTGKTRFSAKTITFFYHDLNTLIKTFKREDEAYKINRKHLIHHSLSIVTKKVKSLPRELKAGELNKFLSKFTSYDRITADDIDSLSQVISNLPSGKITSTAHIIRTKEKLDTIYLEDIIEEFEQLQRTRAGSEEAWQNFFERNTWTLNHLFPYEVILRQGKAFVGGKTIENAEGRIVDFLFESGFKDNFALLEIKPPDKPLLKPTPYRKPDVFAISDDLSGGVNQCLDQKDLFQRDLGQKYKSLDPACILVIGEKSKLNEHQSKCFELYRANQKNVDVVTYDELLSKLHGLHSVITGKRK